jgi:ferredoxin
MFFLTFGSVLLFERQSFCRYGCLVGRVSGLYSLFSSVELRARDGAVCAACQTRDCYHGNERAAPCPTSQYLGGMNKNTYCIFCMECVRACPHDNVALNLRSFGRDLVKPRPARFDEAAMVIVMLAMSTFHGITMTPAWEHIVSSLQASWSIGHLPAFSLSMAGFLTVLGLLYVAFVALSFAVARAPAMNLKQLAVRYSYAFLPIALFYHLAHNVLHFAIEGGTLARVISDPFGWGWNLFGTAHMTTGPLLSIQGVGILTVALILTGHLWSLAVGHKIALQVYDSKGMATRSQLPIMAGMIAYSILSLWLVGQPMQMKTGL